MQVKDVITMAKVKFPQLNVVIIPKPFFHSSAQNIPPWAFALSARLFFGTRSWDHPEIIKIANSGTAMVPLLIAPSALLGIVQCPGPNA